MTSELVSKITIRLHVFPFLVKVGRKVRKISSSLQYYEVEISFQVTIFLSSLDDDTKWRQFLHPCKMSRMPIKPKHPFHFYLHLPGLPTTLRVRFSDENPSFPVSFLWFEVLRVNRKVKENPLYFWRRLFSGISNAATAEFSSCFCILDEAWNAEFLVF